MERGDATEEELVVRTLGSCLSLIKWRLRHSSMSRLQTDILALGTRLRPLVMVDYGGKMPELQENLCLLLHHCRKGWDMELCELFRGAFGCASMANQAEMHKNVPISLHFANPFIIVMWHELSILRPLRVMVIQDMIYLIHVEALTEYVQSSLDSPQQMIFVDLEQDPLKMVTQPEQHKVALQLLSIQKFFSAILSANGANKDIFPEECLPMNGQERESAKHACSTLAHLGEPVVSASSEVVDLSSCMQDTDVTLPTLNGWLLGYPVVYLSGKEHMADAVYNLSTKRLNLFKIVVGRNRQPTKGPRHEELMSFTVPYDLSMGGESEPWAEAFLSCMQRKFERCNTSWRYLRMDVSECYPQSVVL